MKTIKHPNWDKPDNIQIMFNPDSPHKEPSLEGSFKVGWRVMGKVAGVEITVQIINLVSPIEAEAEIISIRVGKERQETSGDLAEYDIVNIKHKDVCRFEND